MEVNIKATTLMGRKTEKDIMFGKMEAVIEETGQVIK